MGVYGSTHKQGVPRMTSQRTGNGLATRCYPREDVAALGKSQHHAGGG